MVLPERVVIMPISLPLRLLSFNAPVHSSEIHYCQCQCVGCVLHSAQESCVIRHSKQICGEATSKPSALSWVKTQAIGELAQSFNRETTRALCHYAYFFSSAAPCICRFIISVSHLLQDFLEQCGVALDKKSSRTISFGFNLILMLIHTIIVSDVMDCLLSLCRFPRGSEIKLLVIVFVCVCHS